MLPYPRIQSIIRLYLSFLRQFSSNKQYYNIIFIIYLYIYNYFVLYYFKNRFILYCCYYYMLYYLDKYLYSVNIMFDVILKNRLIFDYYCCYMLYYVWKIDWYYIIIMIMGYVIEINQYMMFKRWFCVGFSWWCGCSWCSSGSGSWFEALCRLSVRVFTDVAASG